MLSSRLASCRTVGEALAKITQVLSTAGLDSPRRTAELLLCHVLGWDRLRLVLERSTPLPPTARRRLSLLLRRRLRREPVQYLLRETEFFGLRLSLRRGVFIPRPETELLVEEALALLRRGSLPHPVRVLDIGTGSGCIALAIAYHCMRADVLGIDTSLRALLVARYNARRLGLRNVRFARVDILRELPPEQPFHLIVSNPPYIPAADLPHLQPEVRLHEPREALTDGGDGLGFYRRFAQIFPVLLSPGGLFLLEVGAGSMNSVAELFRPNARWLRIRKDYAGHDRILVGTLQPSSVADPPALTKFARSL
ncbi:MAG: peptide chain release factor N(5)-glutamine methyltransferase [Candidatus Kapabacteria bacterium]|nr:peptide chain release factor N(5)-glutamine methyltransferase [Candidatus Kapabacteria bacterium]MDW8012557.1 peptide chain release factor N(5)-glutamine methyltransferase [Bacteroidota bacterium]